MIAVASSPAHHSPWRPALAALAGGVALLAAVAAALGVFARGDGSFVTVTSARGEVYEMATTGVYANNALQVVAEGVGGTSSPSPWRRRRSCSRRSAPGAGRAARR